MTSLVVGSHLLLVFRHDHGPAFRAHHHLVFRVFEFLHRDETLVTPGSQQRGLVDEVSKIRTGKARRAASDSACIHIRRQRHFLHVNAKDFLAPVNIRDRHDNLTVKTARTQQGRVKHVGAVGRCDDDDAFIGFKAVHLDQQLVQGLLALVIGIAEAVPTMATNRINLVDEDNARRVLLSLFEHVAHTARADADKHFDKIRA